jgi:hypothetical protein
MSEPLQYAAPACRSPSKALALFANLTAAYPLVAAAFLYGEWLFAAYTLGHAPVPSFDDPKDINTSDWMHLPTALALFGLIPAGILALLLNAIHVAYHHIVGVRLIVRIGILTVLWLGLFLLLWWDPGSVVNWWGD